MLSSIKAKLFNKQPVKIFNLSVYEWLPKGDILIGLILATVLINILSLIFPLSLLQIYDRIIPNEATATLFYLISAVSIAIILEMVIKLARSYVSAWGDARLGYKSSISAFDHLIHAKLEDYERTGSGVHLDRLNSLNRVKDFYGGQAVTTLLDLPFVLVFLGIIVMIEPIMVVVPIVIQISIVALSYQFGPIVFETLKQRSDTNDKKLNYIVEVLTGIHTIKSQGMEQLMLRRYERLQNSSAFDDYDFAQRSAYHNRMGTILSQINLIGIVFLGAILVLHQQLTPGGVAACILLSSRCMMPFVKAMNLWSRFQSIKLSKEKNIAIHQLEQEDHRKKNIDVKKGDIELKNVSFGFHETEPLILKDINLTIKQGETISIESDGAQGKSTLLLLVKGLLTPNEGLVTLSGKPISDYNSQILGSQVAYLPQEGVLFQGTILDNLTLFRGHEFAHKAKELSEALELDKYIEQMPQGYQTLLGQGSVDLVSKGIKQRILIVRSLVDDPNIILFDEANSAMDIASDMKLKSLIKSYHRERTIIIVSHRPSFTALADRKIVISNQTLKEVT